MRPIALFDRTLRLATGMLLDYIGKLLHQRIFPHQFGVGTQAGAEVMLRIARAFAAANPDKVLIATDVKNAVGMLHRDAVLKALKQTAPELLPCM